MTMADRILALVLAGLTVAAVIGVIFAIVELAR